MKDRKVHPLEVEKQILDGIKVVLENGWVLSSNELIAFLDSLNLGDKANELIKHD